MQLEEDIFLCYCKSELVFQIRVRTGLGYRVGFEVPSMTCIWSSNSSTVAGGTPAATTHHPLPSRKKEEFSPSYVFGCETNAELLQRQVISKYPWSSY